MVEISLVLDIMQESASRNMCICVLQKFAKCVWGVTGFGKIC